MIKRVERGDVLPYSGQPVAFTKIYTEYAAYDDAPVFSSGAGSLVALHGADATVIINGDDDEIGEFLRFYGVRRVFCEGTANIPYYGKMAQHGIIMRYVGGETGSGEQVAFPDYGEIFDILHLCGLDLPKRDDFIHDMFMRVRAGCARVAKCPDFAVALTSAECEKFALIGAVGCMEKYRREGRGTNSLKSLCGALLRDEKEIFLCREENNNKEFYRENGFEDVGDFAVYEFEDEQ